MVSKLPESVVVKTWQSLLSAGTELALDGGGPIRVIYPGRANDDRGGDFRDAVVDIGGGLIKGDIEFHARSSDWLSHQHHRNPAYNRVILHVVMWHDTGTATGLQNGESVPVLALDKYMNGSIRRSPARRIPCLGIAKHLSPGVMEEFLDGSGEARFLAREAGFRDDLAQMEHGQALYRGIMGALGYSRNKVPFIELADRLPLSVLETITGDEISDGEYVARQQALLLGTAGLLPSQRRGGHRSNEPGERWTGRLERLWADSKQTGVMSPDDWHLFKVRPNNSPVRRLAAMSYLLLRYREKGLLEGLVGLVREAPLSRGHHYLMAGLTVVSGGSMRNCTLLGGRRAADIAVNVLLPFICALSRHTSQPEPGKKAFDIYRRHPKLAENAIERHMIDQFGLTGGMVNSARRQQGLLHIYKTLCTQGRCDKCLLGGRLTGFNHINAVYVTDIIR